MATEVLSTLKFVPITPNIIPRTVISSEPFNVVKLDFYCINTNFHLVKGWMEGKSVGEKVRGRIGKGRMLLWRRRDGRKEGMLGRALFPALHVPLEGAHPGAAHLDLKVEPF